MIKVKDAQWNADGSITCLYEHPAFGWVPFTASSYDSSTSAVLDVASTLPNIAPYIPQEYVQSTEERVVELRAHLTQIDMDSVRPLRAVAAGTATDFDLQKLAELDAEAAVLRDELRGLLA